MTCRILQRYDYDVLEAADGEEALRVLEREHHRVALLITDVIMPHMDDGNWPRGCRRGIPV